MAATEEYVALATRLGTDGATLAQARTLALAKALALALTLTLALVLALTLTLTGRALRAMGAVLGPTLPLTGSLTLTLSPTLTLTLTLTPRRGRTRATTWGRSSSGPPRSHSSRPTGRPPPSCCHPRRSPRSTRSTAATATPTCRTEARSPHAPLLFVMYEVRM